MCFKLYVEELQHALSEDRLVIVDNTNTTAVEIYPTCWRQMPLGIWQRCTPYDVVAGMRWTCVSKGTDMKFRCVPCTPNSVGWMLGNSHLTGPALWYQSPH